VLVLLVLVMTLIACNVQLTSQLVLVTMDVLVILDCVLAFWLWYVVTSIVPTDSIQLRHMAAIEQGYIWPN
jgi:hypothetical protein